MKTREIWVVTCLYNGSRQPVRNSFSTEQEALEFVQKQVRYSNGSKKIGKFEDILLDCKIQKEERPVSDNTAERIKRIKRIKMLIEKLKEEAKMQ